MYRLSQKLALCLAVIIGLILLLDYLIVTDREAIEQLIRTGIDRVNAGDVDGVMALVSPTYQHEGRDFEGLRQTLINAMQQVRQYTHSLLKYSIEVPGEHGSATIDVLSRPGPKAMTPPMMTSWQLGLREMEDGWFVTEIDRGQ
ncbi:MAG: hypothetical protein RDV41_13090 [Planctomycetota bacterium]|nr:hypothetical protein [Planctomycetota bacterium]